MPIINTALGFEISRTLKTIKVKKIGLNTIDVQLFIKANCSSNSYKKVSDRIVVEDFVEIIIPFQDGKYKIRVTSTATDGSFQYADYLFDSFNKLLDNLIAEIKDKICGCNCKNCNDCTVEDKVENTLLKSISFYILNSNYYSFFFNTALECIDCPILEDINCIVANEFITGKSDNKKLTNKVLSYFYLIFYIGEKAMYNCCTEEIDAKFDIDNIRQCIEGIGINVNCIFDKILTHPDYHISDSNLKLL